MTDLASGPGKLCQAMGIGRAQDGADLVRGPLRILDDGVDPPEDPGVSVRIGITRAADRPWRWYVNGDPNVLYRCNAGNAISVVRRCPNGCQINKNDDDTCK